MHIKGRHLSEICVPITQSQALVVSCADHFKTIQHVNKHEIVFHNLKDLRTHEKAYSIDRKLNDTNGIWKVAQSGQKMHNMVCFKIWFLYNLSLFHNNCSVRMLS